MTTLLLASFLAIPAHAYDFAAPNDVIVHLIADGGAYDGTQDTIWVRVHSADLNSWSGWKLVSGIDATESVGVDFDLSTSFGEVDEVAVYIGPTDGARLTVVVDDGAGSRLFVPESKWVKGGTSSFDETLVSAIICCTTWNSWNQYSGCSTTADTDCGGLFECNPGIGDSC
jgi:hypothetical protein